MKIALISSATDPGGTNIRESIISLMYKKDNDFFPLMQSAEIELIEIKERLIYADDIDKQTDNDLIIFISRHSSTTNPVPALTVHVTGNFGKAEMGGKSRSLTPAATPWMHSVLNNMHDNAPPGYRVSYEVTHHGPTCLNTPSFFAEIGSTEKEWRDKEAGNAVALSILNAAPYCIIPLIGFGGTHYAPRQTDISLRTKGAFGHIVPSRIVNTIDRKQIEEMRDKSSAIGAYIDRKSIPKNTLKNLEYMLENIDLPVVSESEIESAGIVGWQQYLIIKKLADLIQEGSKPIINPHFSYNQPTIIELPEELIYEAWKSDKSAILSGLKNIHVIYLFSKNGALLPRMIVESGMEQQIIHALITLCVKTLTYSGDTTVGKNKLVITYNKFDPVKARKYGIKKGPEFGKLVSGQTIISDERTITPEMVHTSQKKEIRIPGLEKYL